MTYSWKCCEHPTNLAESLKQLLWKSRQQIALQLQISEVLETVEDATGQRSEAVAAQVQLQQVPLEVIIIILQITPIITTISFTLKNIFIKICQLILLQVQLSQVVQPVEGSAAKASEPVAFQPQAAEMPEIGEDIGR